MIGSMRDRLVFKRAVTQQQVGGGYIPYYELAFAVWGKTSPVKSDRSLEDSQVQLQDAISFTIRWDSFYTVDKTMLIEYRGKDYTINSIKEVQERKRFWVIVAYTDGGVVQPIITT